MNVHFYKCEFGTHITLWRLQIYLLHNCKPAWKPFRGADGSLYFLKFCIELI